MDRAELAKILVSEGFRPSAYSLNEGLVDEALCLRKDGSTWVVFYSERGLETGKISFPTESEACEYFLSEMRADPTTKAAWRSGWSMSKPSH
jgi:hypothetical protein